MTDDLAMKLHSVELPTLGHFIEEGFLPAAIAAVEPGMRMIGRARTVQIPDFDAAAVNRAILNLRPSEVLVIDMGADDPHACVGAVTIAALAARQAAGVLVNGLVTDLDVLTDTSHGSPTPVFARGHAALTTKRKASGQARFDVTIDIGGTLVRPGDWVIGDRNGVLVASDATLNDVIDEAIASDEQEPAILERIRSGEPLEEILWLG